MSVYRTYRQPATLATCTLRYFIDREGQYVVALYRPAGEDIAPDAWRLPTIEAARAQWRAALATIRRAGYTDPQD